MVLCPMMCVWCLGCVCVMTCWCDTGQRWTEVLLLAQSCQLLCNHSNSVCVYLPLLLPCSGVMPSAATYGSSLNLWKSLRVRQTHTHTLIKDQSFLSRHSECLSAGIKMTTNSSDPHTSSVLSMRTSAETLMFELTGLLLSRSLVYWHYSCMSWIHFDRLETDMVHEQSVKTSEDEQVKN